MAGQIVVFSLLTSPVIILLWITSAGGQYKDIPCSSNDNCHSTKNDYCESGECSCLHAHNDTGINCLPRLIGERCSNTADCTQISNSQCMNGTCMCILKNIPQSIWTQCLLESTPDQCSEGSTCSNALGNRSCSGSDCRCPEGYSEKGTRCLARKLGDYCKEDSHCASVMNNTECKEKKCACSEYYIPDGDRGCRFRRWGDSCTKGPHCSRDRTLRCKNHHCVCRLEHTNITDVSGGETQCVKTQLGDSCSKTEDCPSINGIECDKKLICECNEDKGFKRSQDNQTCVQRQLNDACINKKQCQLVKNSVCENGICACKPGFKENESLSGNPPSCTSKVIGDICKPDNECRVNNSHCDNGGTCTCNKGFASSDEFRVCTEKILNGKSCPNIIDCELMVPHSHCDSVNTSTCVCDIGYHSSDNFSVCIQTGLNDTCGFDEECRTSNDHSFCSNASKRCECVPGFAATFQFKSKPFCSRRILGDQPCETTDDCSLSIANSSCVSCSLAAHRSFCKRPCSGSDSRDGDGVSSIINSTDVCSSRTCMCNKGFSSNHDNTTCEAIGLRDPCSDDSDCTVHVPNSVCLTDWSRCDCAPGYIIGYTTAGKSGCIKRIIGDSCKDTSDCENAVPFSFCKKSDDNSPFGSCRCNSGYHDFNNTVCRKRYIGYKPCAVHSDCEDAVNNSYCLITTCACKKGYFRNDDFTECHARKLGSDYCENNLDCNATINNSICDNHVCICSKGFYNITENECIKRNINHNCTADIECAQAVNHSECVNNKCGCVSGFVALNDSMCTSRMIGSDCDNFRDCWDAVKNSTCSNGSCVCLHGFYPSKDNTACVKRMITDPCSEKSDCGVNRSDCIEGKCDCMTGFDAHNNGTECVKGPVHIEDTCYFLEQCQRIDPRSTCHSHRCKCPLDTFVARNRSVCIPVPTSIGQYCLDNALCILTIPNSICNSNNSCSCSHGYFVGSNMTTCHRYPERFGEFCLEKENCKKLINSTCEPENNTCVCQYGHTQKSRRVCIERTPLSSFIQPEHQDPPACADNCTKWTNSLCVGEKLLQHCRCDYRHARKNNSLECVAVQTYQLELSLAQVAGVYDYWPLYFQPGYLNKKSPDYTQLAARITLSGLMKLFEESNYTSPLKDRYVASHVTGFQPKSSDTGVQASILLHLAATMNYFDATSASDIADFLVMSLDNSTALLGESQLKVASPYREAVAVYDYDECTERQHDCSKNATCINTLGSFMCVCWSRYSDVSRKHNHRPGRDCVPAVIGPDESSDGICSSGDCQTKWEFVGLAVTLFLLIVMSFITYEIIQRKQTFTARKLYEKFGTTKIRKLRHASMQRLQERKKKKKEENKKKKEEEKEKKEELKREKSEKRKRTGEEKKMKQEEKKQKDLEKKGGKKTQKETSDVVVECFEDTSEADNSPPSPLEVVNQPPQPFTMTTDDSPDQDFSSLPGTVNTPEMGYSRRVVSPIEESPV